MATRFDIQNIEDDSKTYARSCHVRIGTGCTSFDIPLKAGSGTNVEAEFYEAYRSLKPDTIQKSLKNERYARKVDLELSKRCKGRFNMLIMEYDSKDVVPTPRMVEYLSDIQYNHTDVVITPSWSSLITHDDHTDVDLYVKMTDEYLDAATRLNHKPLVVSIPQSIPPDRIDEILDRYIGRDVTAFCIDSNNRSLMNGSWMRRFHTTMDRTKEQYGIERESLLLSVNAYQGMVKKNENATEARDFLGFSAGIDVICGKHTNARGGGDEEGSTTVARMFQPETYNYIKRPCQKGEKDLITDRSVAAQMTEMSNVRRNIAEGTLEQLLRSKAITPGTMKTIYGMKDRGMTTLDRFI